MMALPRNAASSKPWFERLPLRTRRTIVIGAAGIVAVIALSILMHWYHRSQPAYVLQVLDEINTPADVQQQREYLTTQGKDIVLWLQKKAGDKPSSGSKAIYSEPVINGNVSDIHFQISGLTGSIRLVKTDHWRFHDLYFDKAEDKKIELWASYMKDHPIGAWWSIHGDEMFAAFCNGALIGARAAR